MVNSVSGCGAKGCIDFYDQATVKRLQEWYESDARFLQNLCMKKDNDHQTKKSYQEEGLGYFQLFTPSSERSIESPDRFTVRQIFLRSYTFVREEENSKETAMKKIINKLLRKNKKINNNNNNNNNNNLEQLVKKERGLVLLLRDTVSCFPVLHGSTFMPDAFMDTDMK